MHDDDIWKKALGLGFSGYRDPMQEYLEQQRRLQDSLDPPHDRLLRQLQNSALGVMHDFDALGHSGSSVLDQLNRALASMDSSAKLQQVIYQSRLLGLDREDYFQRVANLSVVTERRLSQIPWNSVGDLLGISEESRSRLQSRFTKLAVSYGRLHKPDLEEGRDDAGEVLPSEIANLPAAEVYQNINLLDEVSSDAHESKEGTPAAEQVEDKMLDIGQTFRLETESALEHLLDEINPEFVRLLEGAKVAANSINPDRVRHVAVSLRELFTHVLHALAPTGAIKAWSSDSAHYAAGKPTRRARILYIYRSVSFGYLSNFLVKDIAVTLEFVDLFQGATHEVSAHVSSEQLLAMIVRMEGLLRILLETARLAR